MCMNDLNDKKLLQAVFEEVGTVKEKITEVEINAEESREEVNEKLDKILEVVSQRLSTQDKKIRRIENHLGMPALV